MSDAAASLSIEDADQTFSILAVSIDQFVAAWDGDDIPPMLDDFVPAEEIMRRVVLTELIKVDLDYRWLQFNLPKSLSEYLEDFPDLKSPTVPVDLVYEEFHIRQRAEDSPDIEKYLKNYPDIADELKKLLDLSSESISESTRIIDPESREEMRRFEPGQKADDFDLLVKLGEGAFGTVFLARQISMQRLVALKLTANRGDEPQTLAQLDHENIVRVYDQRVDSVSKLRMMYMQYLPGGTLSDLVEIVNETLLEERSGKLLIKCVNKSLDDRGESPPEESRTRERLQEMNWPETVCWIGVGLANALDYAHHRGVLHRDLKPANVLLSREGVPKLADFNISFSSEISGASPAAYFGGSLAYMSPEQLEATHPWYERRKDELDGRSDLYSLGIVLWELLIGTRPFDGAPIGASWLEAVDAFVKRRRSIDFELLRGRVPEGCPPGLIETIFRCLAPDPNDRWESGKELAQRLELVLNPEVDRLLNPPETLVRNLTWRFASLFLFLAIFLPNAVAAVFNFLYNRAEIIENLQDATAKFDNIQAVINGIAFPVGVGFFLYLAVPTVRKIRDSTTNKIGEKTRLLVFRLGLYGALIGSVEWVLAGIAYPISIRAVGVQMPVDAYFHFFASLVICGLVAASYPFFFVTLFCMRSLCPRIWQGSLRRVADDRKSLKLVASMLNPFLLISALVPLLGIASLLSFGSESRFGMSVLSIVGLFGFAAIFGLYRQLSNDVGLLLKESRNR